MFVSDCQSFLFIILRTLPDSHLLNKTDTLIEERIKLTVGCARFIHLTVVLIRFSATIRYKLDRAGEMD